MQVLKIQPQSIKSSYIKLIVLMCSLVYSVTAVITLQATITTQDSASVISTSGISEFGVASLTAYGIIGVSYLVIAIVYIVILNLMKEYKSSKLSWFVDAGYFIGGLFYYIARNVSVPVAQPILLGMVVVFYRFIPFFISKYYQSNLAKERQTTEAKLQLVPEWILAAESLILTTRFYLQFKQWNRSNCAMGLIRSYVHDDSVLHNEHSVQ